MGLNSGVKGELKKIDTSKRFGIADESAELLKGMDLLQRELWALEEEVSVKLNRILSAARAVPAQLLIQDLIYCAHESSYKGVAGNFVSVEYTGGATAGSEVVSVSGPNVSIQIEDATSTAIQIKTAVEASAEASMLVRPVLVGTASNTQTTASKMNLAGGSGIL